MIDFAIEKEGYDKAQVDGCIERIEIEYKRLYVENQTLQFQLKQVQQQFEQTQQQLWDVQEQLDQEKAIVVEKNEEQAEAIGRALLGAETMAQHIIKDAREQAWKIITDAKKGLPIPENTESSSEPTEAVNLSKAESIENPPEKEDTEKPSEEEAEINEENSAKSNSKAGRLLSNIVFYGALVMLLVVVFAYTQSGASRSIFGYSYFNILTTSMQSTLPQGSFILVKETPGEELQVGDDITYFKNENTIITHRIIGIYEDYEDSGQYGFRTQGTDNPSPDAYITYEGNVIGKVVYHIPMLGFVLEYIANNIWIVVIGFALILALSYFLKIVFTPEKPKVKKAELG